LDALEFLGRPIRTFFDLRRQISAEVVRFNTAVEKSYISSQKEAGAALESVRNLSADLTSFGEAEWLANFFSPMDGLLSGYGRRTLR
jgi:hypothetical protein